MTILDEGKQIRSEVARLRPDKRRRYPDELRMRILNWVDRSTTAGMMEHECSKAIGVKTYRFTLWRRAAASRRTEQVATRKPRTESLALVRIETPLVQVAAPTLSVVVGPSGHRVEGLELAQVVVLLRELA